VTQRAPKAAQYGPHGVFLEFSRVFSDFIEFSRVLGGVQGSTGGRGPDPSGLLVKQHFGLKTVINTCVFQHFTFSAPRRLLDSDLSHLSKTPQGR